MRECMRCGAKMVEGLQAMVEYNGMGSIAKGVMGMVRKDIAVAVKAAVCPECGEVSFYLEDVGALRESTKYLML